MDPKSLVTVILFAPLIGAITAGLFGRRIGDTVSMAVTTGLLFLAAILSWTVFSMWTWGGLEPFTLTYLPFILTGAIATLSALDFLGFGMPAGSASLGELIGQGKSNLQAPWLGLTAFFVLALILSLLVFIGEACRDAYDPRT